MDKEELEKILQKEIGHSFIIAIPGLILAIILYIGQQGLWILPWSIVVFIFGVNSALSKVKHDYLKRK